ncbi:MAG: glycoside hydrolase domain-containing protein [Candidatus Brocadiia bacterium]
MALRILLLGALLAPALSSAAELDLFVTDYLQNPSPDQQPLVDRPLTFVEPQEVVVKTADGQARTYDSVAKVDLQREGVGDPREARLFASLGEYEPFSFLLRPRESLQDVFITAGALQGPAGTIPQANVAVASIEGFHGGGRTTLLPLGRTWHMPAHSTEFFWVTVHVPEDAKPGLYRGKVTVTAEKKPVGSIAVVLEVLPIRLEDPPYALGFNYSSPKDPEALAAHLADMREHGMTTVAPLYNFHLPIHDDDTSELGKFIEAYRKAGFPAPLYFATPMNLQVSALAGYGSVDSRRWQQKYIQVMRRLHAETRKHPVPVLMSIGDELTNKGIEGVKIAGKLARFVWEELPEIATTSDMNGYMEVRAMAPWLNVATFNNGWDGIDHHNKGRHLMNKDFISQLQEDTGAIPWFVNAGVGRFPFGFYFWKATRFGVRGKVEWYYCLRNGRGSVVRLDGPRVWPTIDYERCREGVDDLKYLGHLERLVARAREAGRAAAERRRAEALLARIADSIHDDWTAYRRGGESFPPPGFQVMDPADTVGMGPFDVVRRALADRILALQAALQ